jgi:pimeloyl-[acyl-carrier protein] methyl ester esterase
MVAIVLLPGLDGTGQLFADFVAALGPSVEVIVASYPANTALDYPELETIARSFLPENKPYFLLAESFSGPIAISIAASSPAGLLGLILCCSFVRNPLPLLSIVRPLIGIAPVAALPTVLLSFFVLGRFSSPALRTALAKALVSVAPSVLRARAQAAISVNVSALVSHIKVPLLYLRASEDRIVSKASCQAVVSLSPSTQVVEFPAPHFLLQVLPTQAASSVVGFMGARHEF